MAVAPRMVASERRAARGAEAPARYSFRRLSMKEIPLLNDLYNQCHHTDRPVEEAQWLYRDNPNGPALILGAFDLDNRLAGMRPAVAWKFLWRGQPRAAYLFTDAVVHPRDRGRGLFSHLVRLICEEAARERASLFSFPNENSLRVYQKSGLFQALGDCEVRVRPVSWRRYLRYQAVGDGGERRAPRPAPRVEEPLYDRGFTLRPIRRFEGGFEHVHAALAKTVTSFTLRRKEFLNWRYFGSPLRIYQVAVIEEEGDAQGYVVVRLLGGIAQVMDVFLLPDREIARAAFRLLLRWAEQMGAAAVYFNASRGNWFQGEFARAGGWLKKKSGSLVLDLPSARHLAYRTERVDLRDLYFVMGDFDFF